MARIVVVSQSEDSRSKLVRLLASSGLQVFRSCSSGSELRRALSESEDCVVVMIESPNIFRLAMPASGQAVIGAVEMLSQLHRMKLPHRTGESKDIVDRAKAVLMKQKGLTEPEAHRAMQQYAMNHGMKMAEFAQQILDKSE